MRKFSFLVPSLVCFVLAAMAVVVARTASPDNDSANPSTKAQLASIGDIPGLGETDAAGNRDDLIAYFEAWGRQNYVSGCMTRQGFAYVPLVEYPVESLTFSLSNMALMARTAWQGRRKLSPLRSAPLLDTIPAISLP